MVITLLIPWIMLGFKEYGVLSARPMLTHNVTELVISFTSDEIDLEFMPTSGHHYVIRVFGGDDMNTIYTGVYCHLKCSIRLFRKGYYRNNVKRG